MNQSPFNRESGIIPFVHRFFSVESLFEIRWHAIESPTFSRWILLKPSFSSWLCLTIRYFMVLLNPLVHHYLSIQWLFHGYTVYLIFRHTQYWLKGGPSRLFFLLMLSREWCNDLSYPFIPIRKLLYKNHIQSSHSLQNLGHHIFFMTSSFSHRFSMAVLSFCRGPSKLHGIATFPQRLGHLATGKVKGGKLAQTWSKNRSCR